jgi:hypothetical protein
MENDMTLTNLAWAMGLTLRFVFISDGYSEVVAVEPMNSS